MSPTLNESTETKLVILPIEDDSLLSMLLLLSLLLLLLLSNFFLKDFKKISEIKIDRKLMQSFLPTNKAC